MLGGLGERTETYRRTRRLTELVQDVQELLRAGDAADFIGHHARLDEMIAGNRAADFAIAAALARSIALATAVLAFQLRAQVAHLRGRDAHVLVRLLDVRVHILGRHIDVDLELFRDQLGFVDAFRATTTFP